MSLAQDIILGTIAPDVESLIGGDFVGEVTAPEKSRKRHHHIVGSNGSGKSRFIQSLIRQDIRAGRGVVLIDPHGTLCTDIIQWLAEHPRLAKHRKIRVFDVGKGDNILSFNPLKINNRLEAQPNAARLADALGRLFSKEDLREQPRTLEVLLMVLITLSENGLTLGDYAQLLDPHNRSLRDFLIKQLVNQSTKDQWELLSHYRPNDFVEYVSSVSRRLYSLLANPIISLSFNMAQDSIDFSEAMDDGEILLFNLADTRVFDPVSSQLFGLLLISTLFGQSKLRKNTEPNYLYIDEAHRFLSGSNLAEIFEECRKYGLHIVLAHQNLGQLRDAGDRVFNTVMSEAEIKTIFRINEPDDAQYLTKTVFGGLIDPERVKGVLSKPTVVGFTLNTIQSYSTSSSSSSARSKNEGMSMGITSLPDAGLLSDASQLTNTSGEASGTANVSGSSNSNTHGTSQTYLPVLEERAGGTWGVDEQVHVLANQISSLETQIGIMAVGKNEALKFRALDIPDQKTPSSILIPFISKLQADNPYLRTAKNAKELVERRKEDLVCKLERSYMYENDEADYSN